MAVTPQRFTEIEGLRVHFRMRGEGELLLLLHGWGASSLNFAPVAPGLEKRFRVLTPDLPGFGFSEAPPVAWGAADFARIVAALLESTGSGPANVVGHSFGGLVATALVTSRPELVRRLVLVASPVVRLPQSSGVRRRSVAYGWARRAAHLLPPLRERILDWARMRYGSADYRNAGPLRPTLVRVLSEDWREALTEVTVPTLLIYGEKDDDVPLGVAEAAMRELPAGASLTVVPGAGHFPFLDDTPGFVEAVSAFLLTEKAAADA